MVWGYAVAFSNGMLDCGRMQLPTLVFHPPQGHLVPPHIRMRDLTRTAWTYSLAYTADARTTQGKLKHKRPKLWAAAMWPAALLSHFLIGHRNIFEAKNKMAIFSCYWTPQWGRIGRLAVFVAPVIVVWLLPVPFALETVVTILYLLVLVPMFALVATVGSGSKSARGTKKIDIPSRHVEIGFVASHPKADATEGSRLAAETLGMLPEGTFVVAHPRTARLRAYYRLRGFEESKGKVMVKPL